MIFYILATLKRQPFPIDSAVVNRKSKSHANLSSRQRASDVNHNIANSSNPWFMNNLTNGAIPSTHASCSLVNQVFTSVCKGFQIGQLRMTIDSRNHLAKSNVETPLKIAILSLKRMHPDEVAAALHLREKDCLT
jgi:hypothetical protein